jgi:hypothetical protein
LRREHAANGRPETVGDCRDVRHRLLLHEGLIRPGINDIKLLVFVLCKPAVINCQVVIMKLIHSEVSSVISLKRALSMIIMDNGKQLIKVIHTLAFLFLVKTSYCTFLCCTVNGMQQV